MNTKLIVILSLFSNITFAQFQGPISAITSGYGSDGLLPVSVTNITNDHFSTKDISVFYPTGTNTPIPTIFYAHAYGGNDTTRQIELLHHIASKGYAVVFVPYKTTGVTISERYLTLFDGFVKSAQTLPTIIDISRIGFYGHSFGGGATPRISYRLFTEKNWGVNGKFIYCSAPWYSFELGSTNLDNFPTDCNMLTVLYDNDETNDHRMGMDIFNNIAINDNIKDCIIVFLDTISGYIYQADHNLPTQNLGNNEFDAFDYYIPFRFLDALADYAFTGNLTAKNIALGNGSPSQIDMGEQLKQLFVTDNPSPVYSEIIYQFPCSSATNERQAFCQDILGVEDENLIEDKITIYPNPTSGKIKINCDFNYQNIKVFVYNILGEKIMLFENQPEFEILSLTTGIYYLKIAIDNLVETKKIIKIE
jgi:dienelactone hydrolase